MRAVPGNIPDTGRLNEAHRRADLIVVKASIIEGWPSEERLTYLRDSQREQLRCADALLSKINALLKREGV